LMQMEYKGTGRVRLTEYYKGWADMSWYFTESADYLRSLGALDESDPRNPSVIIPNWLISRTNCVTPSDFYLVCCLNECEGLMASLENMIEGPVAAPARIAEAVSALPSDTVDAPRSLAQVQLERLEDIANLHGGEVPLHGRLFAQWMHHAYPRECPYPHATGTTNPISPDDWTAKHGGIEEEEHVMERHATRRMDADNISEPMTSEAKVEALPWDSMEELLTTPRQSQGAQGMKAFQIGVLVLFAASALQGMRGVLRPTKGQKQHWV